MCQLIPIFVGGIRDKPTNIPHSQFIPLSLSDQHVLLFYMYLDPRKHAVHFRVAFYPIKHKPLHVANSIRLCKILCKNTHLFIAISGESLSMKITKILVGIISFGHHICQSKFVMAVYRILYYFV